MKKNLRSERRKRRAAEARAESAEGLLWESASAVEVLAAAMVWRAVRRWWVATELVLQLRGPLGVVADCPLVVGRLAFT